MGLDEKKNYIYSVVYRLSICVLPLVITPYIARVLGAEQVGVYAFSSTVACYFIMLGKLGLDNYGNRSIASCREDIEKRSRTFWGIYIIQMITSVLSILAYLLVILLIVENNRDVYFIQLLYVGSVLFDVSWFFFGMEQFRITTIRSLVSRTIIIVCVFVFVRSGKDLWVYTCVMSACFLLEQLQLLPHMLRQVRRVTLKQEDIVCHIVPNIRLFVPLLALSIYHWTDKIMLGVLLSGTAVVAFYTYAENIINLPKGILLALDTVMLPRISGMVAKNQLREGVEKIRNSIKFNGFICCALCFGIAGVAPNFIPWFLGTEFKPTVALTMELAIVMLPMSITNVIQTQYLIPFRQESIYIRAVSIGAILNIVINLALIPFLGGTGAVIGTLAAETVVCVYQITRIRNIYRMGHLFKVLGPFLASGMLEFAVVYSLNSLPLQPLLLLLLQILIGSTVYLIGCGVYMIVISKEYHNIIEIIHNLGYRKG